MPVPSDLPADTHLKKLSTAGTFTLETVTCMVNGQRARQQVLIVTDGNKTGDQIIVTDLQGEILIEQT